MRITLSDNDVEYMHTHTHTHTQSNSFSHIKTLNSLDKNQISKTQYAASAASRFECYYYTTTSTIMVMVVANMTVAYHGRVTHGDTAIIIHTIYVYPLAFMTFYFDIIGYIPTSFSRCAVHFEYMECSIVLLLNCVKAFCGRIGICGEDSGFFCCYWCCCCCCSSVSLIPYCQVLPWQSLP